MKDKSTILKNVYRGNAANNEIEIVGDPDIVYDDKYITVVKDPVHFPNGKLGNYLRVVETPSLTGSTGVIVVPYSKDDIYFINIFRHTLRSWSLELPRGGRKDGELIPDCGYRELKEEMGIDITPQKIDVIGSIHPNSGLLTSKVHVMVIDISGIIDKKLSVPPENSESIDFIAAIPMRGVHCVDDQIALGKIHCGMTIAAYGIFKCMFPYLFEY